MNKTPIVDADQKSTGSHPDAEPHLGEEDDSLYEDGLDVDTNAGELAGTRGETPGIAKPQSGAASYHGLARLR